MTTFLNQYYWIKNFRILPIRIPPVPDEIKKLPDEIKNDQTVIKILRRY